MTQKGERDRAGHHCRADGTPSPSSVSSCEPLEAALRVIAGTLRRGTIPENLPENLKDIPLLGQILSDLTELRQLALCNTIGEPGRSFAKEQWAGRTTYGFVADTSRPLNGSGRRKMHILLAEDNILNQKVALKILNKFGYLADAVSDGHEALKALESIPFDLVIMDCEMPLMDGYEAARLIRSLNSTVINPDIPIIALTANGMKGDREKCLAAGMSDHLTKPVDQRELARVLDRWLNRSQKAPGVRASCSEGVKEQIHVLDRKELLGRLMGDENLAMEVIVDFIREVPAKLAQVRDIINVGAASELRKQAHTLKGTCGTIGAMAMGEIAERLEDAARSGDMEQALLLVTEMEKGLQNLQAAASG